MRKALFLIAALLAWPALANEDDPSEIGRNFLRSHSKIVALSGMTVASTEDFARHFPIGDYGCQTRLNQQRGKDTIFVMSCPAYWGSGQRTKFGFVELKDTLVLMDVRINDRSLKGRDLEALLSQPFKTIPTFQHFLLNPDVKVIGAGGNEIGKLQPSIQRLWKEGYNCELLDLQPQTSSISILCPYHDDTSDPRTFDYDFKLTQSGDLVITTGTTRKEGGYRNKLTGSSLAAHSARWFSDR